MLAFKRALLRAKSARSHDVRKLTASSPDQPVGRLHDVLNTGARIPLIGLGTYAGYKPEAYTPEIVYKAIEIGYRHIDTAESYFTEEAVGKGINAAIKAGLVKRQDIFVTTKLWNDHHHPRDVEPTLRRSLQKLGLDYVDAYLVHWPVTNTPGPELDPPYKDTWQAMEDLPAAGLTKAIGVANLSIKKMSEVLSYCRIAPSINQIEMHPLWRNDELLAFNTKHGIHTTAWAPLGGQIVVPSRLMQRPEIVGVADRLRHSPAQVILRWALQRRVSFLPKADLAWQMQANLDLDFELSDANMAIVGGFKDQCRQHDSTDPMDPTFKMFLQPEGPWPNRAALWDDNVTYAAPEGAIA